MWCKVCSVIIILIAIALAVLACSSYADQVQNYLLTIAKFFDVMLPILGVGALLKYLLKCDTCPCCKKGSCSTEESGKA
jgi:hypothetical protein